MNTLFELAKSKVEASDALRKFADKILADWREGDEHWRWVLEASEDQILAWTVAMLYDDAQDESEGSHTLWCNYGSFDHFCTCNRGRVLK